MERKLGGLWGLLIGDALGVPYEFYPAEELPPMAQIEMVPPEGFRKSYAGVPAGTWSDDGAQALCLLESLLDCGRLDLGDFTGKLVDWLSHGRWTADGVVFDVGRQTLAALRAFSQGTPPEESGLVLPEGKGNGALMRTLPLALWHRGGDLDLVLDAHRQALPTHGHPCNQVCCALYCLTARRLLEALPFEAAYQAALACLRGIYGGLPEIYQAELALLEPDGPQQGRGTGYVVDSLKSAVMILTRAQSYEDAVKQAIALGDDTDTTACITGGLAGILFGLESIPARWMETLQGRAAVTALAERLSV